LRLGDSSGLAVEPGDHESGSNESVAAVLAPRVKPISQQGRSKGSAREINTSCTRRGTHGKNPNIGTNRARGPLPPGVLIRGFLIRIGREMIHPQRLLKGGRPRSPGPREPSGRPSRRISEQENDLRLAQAIWHEFRVLTDETASFRQSNTDRDHALLNLVKHGKLVADEFILALYWLCTDPTIAPGWRSRDYLTRVTGFDLRSKDGCLAARRWIKEQFGPDVVRNLDKAAFEGEFGADLSVLTDQLSAVWAAWCDHGKTRD
jgi:hypothetical protein